jgi:hypothetical protein
MTISARTPTSSTVSRSVAMNFIPKAPTNIRMKYSDTMATKMLIAEDPLIHLKRMKIRIARSNMSRMSVNDISKNPKNARYIPYILYPRKDSDKSSDKH